MRLSILSQGLCDVADQLNATSESWSTIAIVTADTQNVAEEKQRFFDAFTNNISYQPAFKYSYVHQLDPALARKALHELAKQIRSTVLDTDKDAYTQRLFRAALYLKIKEDLATCDLIEGLQSRNELQIKSALNQKYPPLDAMLRGIARQSFRALSQARSVPNSNKSHTLSDQDKERIRSLRYDAQQIKRVFEWALARFDLLRSSGQPEGFTVKVSDSVLFVDVRSRSQDGSVIHVPASKEVDGEVLMDLLVHEIAAHARQSKNSELRYGDGSKAIKLENDTLYEGLAMQYEDTVRHEMFGKAGSNTEPFYALAVESASMGKSFYEIFTQQLTMHLHVALTIPVHIDLPAYAKIDPAIFDRARQDAWRVTYRVMRGHIDTTNLLHFGMTKDLAYLRGRVQAPKESAMSHWARDPLVVSPQDIDMIIDFAVKAEKEPIPFQNVAFRFWQEVIKPSFS